MHEHVAKNNFALCTGPTITNKTNKNNEVIKVWPTVCIINLLCMCTDTSKQRCNIISIEFMDQNEILLTVTAQLQLE